MKILIDLTALDDNFSGIERYALNVSRSLIEQHSEYEYLLVFKNKIFEALQKICKRKNVQTLVIPGYHRRWFQLVTLPARLYRCKADIYLFLAFTEPLLFFRKNCVSSIHDVGCWDCAESMRLINRIYFRTVFKKTMKHSRAILTVSNFSKRRICAIGHVPKEKVHVLYSAPDDKFCPGGNIFQDQKLHRKYHLPEHYILTLSTLAVNKNISLLLTAYRKMCEEQDEISVDLVLVGRRPIWSPETYLNNLPKEIQNHVHFTGFVADDDLPDIYRGADCFVFPSRYEGFGLPPVEAMACGIPVLSSDAASMPEILGNGAMYFKSGDMQDLVIKLKKILILDEKEKAGLVAAGSERAGRYSWERTAKDLYQVIQSLV